VEKSKVIGQDPLNILIGHFWLTTFIGLTRKRKAKLKNSKVPIEESTSN